MAYKILYIGKFSPHSVGEEEVARGFETLGHSVTRLYEHATSIGILREAVQREHPDFILYAKFRIQSTIREREEFFRDMKARGIPTVCWVFDLYFGL